MASRWILLAFVPACVVSQLQHCEEPVSGPCVMGECPSPTDSCISTKEGEMCCNEDMVGLSITSVSDDPDDNQPSTTTTTDYDDGETPPSDDDSIPSTRKPSSSSTKKPSTPSTKTRSTPSTKTPPNDDDGDDNTPPAPDEDEETPPPDDDDDKNPSPPDDDEDTPNSDDDENPGPTDDDENPLPPEDEEDASPPDDDENPSPPDEDENPPPPPDGDHNTPNSTDCIDKINPKTGVSDCPMLKYLCNDQVYYALMTEQCPKTCDRCTDDAVSTVPSSSDCIDQVNPKTGVSDCPTHLHLCDDPVYRSLMTEQCPRTCNRCTDTVQQHDTPPSIAPTAPPTAAPPMPATTSCVDQINHRTGISDCPMKAKLCQDSRYLTLMKKQCPRTCGFCS
ncbi:hypothetical protein Aduo_017404 [Ancylostoma duodenale]